MAGAAVGCGLVPWGPWLLCAQVLGVLLHRGGSLSMACSQLSTFQSWCRRTPWDGVLTRVKHFGLHFWDEKCYVNKDPGGGGSGWRTRQLVQPKRWHADKLKLIISHSPHLKQGGEEFFWLLLWDSWKHDFDITLHYAPYFYFYHLLLAWSTRFGWSDRTPVTRVCYTSPIWALLMFDSILWVK